MNTNEIKTNAGFTITNSVTLHGTTVVLGERDSAYGNNGKEYVTWEYNPERDSYYWGHYFSEQYAAERDFLDRLLKLLTPTYRDLDNPRRVAVEVWIDDDPNSRWGTIDQLQQLLQAVDWDKMRVGAMRILDNDDEADATAIANFDAMIRGE